MSTTLYTAQVSRPALQRWARRIPRDLGAALITESVQELLQGDAGAMRALGFFSRINARKRRTRKVRA